MTWCDLNFECGLYLCGGTASLKFRQFNSAVCDAFGVFLVLFGFVGGCGLFGGCRGVGVVKYDVLNA